MHIQRFKRRANTMWAYITRFMLKCMLSFHLVMLTLYFTWTFRAHDIWNGYLVWDRMLIKINTVHMTIVYKKLRDSSTKSNGFYEEGWWNSMHTHIRPRINILCIHFMRYLIENRAFEQITSLTIRLRSTKHTESFVNVSALISSIRYS